MFQTFLPPVDPITTGFDIVSGIITIIGALFGGIFGGNADANIIKAFDGLRQQMVNMGNALMKFAWQIANVVGAIFNALKWLWSNVLGPLVKAIKSIIQQISRVLNKILKPMLDAMKAQRALLMQLYNTWIRPILLVIQRIRNIIHLFQLLHIHIFDALDRTLGKIQGKLLAPIYALLYRVNTLGNWISFILNLQGLLFRGLFLGSMNQNRGGSFSMIAGAPPLGMSALPFQPAPVPSSPTGSTYVDFTAATNTAVITAAQTYATTPAAASAVARLADPAINDPTGRDAKLFAGLFSDATLVEV